MDPDVEKKQEPSLPSTAPGQEYGEIVATQQNMSFFARVIDSFRENPKYVFSVGGHYHEPEN